MDDPPPRGSETTGASDGRTLEQLRQAVRARDAFVAIAAHELRNPMTPILMQVHALLHAAADPKAAVPPAILAGLERLERAVVEVYGRRASTLLQVSRINAGQLELCPIELDLSRLVLDAVERHGPMAAFVGSRLDAAAVEDGLVGLLDEVALEQILDNLLSNALKYGAGQPVLVTLRADGAQARLSVQDHGIGIAPEDQARIFAPFERLMVRGPCGGGFGVGLWVVRQLAEALGGTVAIESAPAAGSTFTVVLPLGLAAGKGSAP
jgi:two-component system, OmpR family, sensor kinase